MKLLDKFISFVFSIIMLMVSILLILIGLKVVDPEIVNYMLGKTLLSEDVLSKGVFNITTLVGIVLFLASLKTTIFMSLFKVNKRGPIAVKTSNGVVQISQDTIVSYAKNATMQFENVRDVSAKVDKRSNGVVIYEDIEVYSDSNIKELIDAIQREVKNKVGVSTGVTIREVNVKVRNSNKKMKASSTTASVTDRIMESTTETVKPSEESTVAVGESTNQVEQPATTFNSTNNSEPNNTTLS